MPERILVAVDGSEAGQAALEAAITSARRAAARLCVLHVVESPDAFPEAAYDRVLLDLEAMRRAHLEAGRAIADGAGARAREAGLEVETLCRERGARRVSTVIAEEADRWEADLVIVGTHGRQGLERLVLGSVAEGVARRAPCSVLLVRARSTRPPAT
jgi:nucleotide-binding universal stress UspA family protein